MKRTVLRLPARLAVLGLFGAALFGCAAVEVVSPGARGLTAEQSAWIISNDDVQIVSLNGNAIRSRVTFQNNTFLDGVRDKLQVEPGSHVVEVRLDNGMYSVKEPMKLRLDAEVATTYHITVNYGQPIGYQVHAYAGIPNPELLKKLDN